MAKTGLIDKLEEDLYDEWKGIDSLKSSPQYVAFQRTQKTLHQDLKEIGKTGDPGLIIESERMLLLNEKARYSNSSEMDGSLDNALSEAKGAQSTYSKIHDPEQYKTVVEAYSSHKNQKGGLPKDETRQFFSSQSIRILNLSKARMSDEEKDIYKTRRQNINKGNTAYIAMQKKVLGIDQNASQNAQSKDNEDGFEL